LALSVRIVNFGIFLIINGGQIIRVGLLIVLPFVHDAVSVLAFLENVPDWETLPSLGFLVKLNVSSAGTLLGGWH
jgi:hypothetical protein